MRIAAGVILIIVALSNLVGGFGYSLGGGLVVAGSEVAEDTNDGAKDEQLTTEEEHAENDKNIKKAKAAGGMLAGVGFYLLILGGLEIAAAVLLFMAKKATFIRVICVMEFIGIGLVAMAVGPPGLFALIGAVGAVLGLVSSGSIAKAQTQAA